MGLISYLNYYIHDPLIWFWLVIYFIFLLIPSLVSYSKDRGLFGVFLISLFFTPILGLIVSCCMIPDHIGAGLKKDTKKCPYCAELIKPDSVICRFCQREQE